MTKKIKVNNKRKFAKATTDKNTKSFITYVAVLELLELAVLIQLSETLLPSTLKQEEIQSEIYKE